MQISATELQEDIESGCLIEVGKASCSYYDNVRGLTVRQSFFVYPNGAIVCKSIADSKCQAFVLDGDDEVIFQSLYKEFFNVKN